MANSVDDDEPEQDGPPATASETSELLVRLGSLMQATAGCRDLHGFRSAILRWLETQLGVAWAFAGRADPALDEGCFLGLDDAQIERVRTALPGVADALEWHAKQARPPAAMTQWSLEDLRARRCAFAERVVTPLGASHVVTGAAWILDHPIVFLCLGLRAPLDRRGMRVVNAVTPLLGVAESRHGRPSLALSRTSGEADAALTSAERDLVQYVALGYTNRDIGLARGTSPNTVKNQLIALYRKLGASTRAELVQIAHETGLLGGPPGGA